jgi:antirestriction protein ArdC
MYTKHSRKVNYTDITAKIIKMMKDGIMPMGSQWQSDRYKVLPFNLATDKIYRGMNILNLWVEEMDKGFKSNGWITINQMRTITRDDELDESIQLIKLPDDAPNRADNKTGQRGTPVFHGDNFIPKEWTQQDTGNDTEVWRSERTGDYAGRSAITRSYLKCVGVVFNLDQIENLPKKYQNFDALRPLEEHEPDITTLTSTYGIPILLSETGGCYYRVDKHSVYLVHQDQFKSPTDFERVKFHELIHSTGHPSLLGRLKIGEKRTMEETAKEELVAELGAAFMCAQFGIPGLMVHAEYIDHYVKVLKKDNRAIFTAAAKAQAATELLMSHLTLKQEEAA